MDRTPISRRSVLAAVPAAAALAAFAPAPAEAHGRPGTPGRPGAPGRPGSPGAAQPVETGWSARTPRLTTPWTAAVTPENALPEYPRPQLVRDQWASLNGVWQFGALAEGEQPTPGAELGERILVPYPVESALSGIMRHEERMAYRRRFVVPRSWGVGHGRDRRLILNLDAVDFHADVLVNGHPVGSHDGGYDRFSLDVTDALITDRSGAPAGEQELIVMAVDPTEDGVQPLGKQRVSALDPAAPHSVLYYTPASGIWRSVWLEPVPSVHVERFVAAPDPGEGRVLVTVEATGGAVVPVGLRVREGHRVVAQASGVTGSAVEVSIPSPRLWSPESPFLYDVDVDLARGGDRVTASLAMRTVTLGDIDGVPRILLNGRPMPQISCLQQGFWPDGVYTAATDEALRFDVEQAKALGYTTIRKHQKVEPDRWYHWADRLGVLVWQDMPATATGRQPPHQAVPAQPPEDGKVEFERELHAVVDQLSAFGCIVLWIPFNEGWGAYDLKRVGDEVRAWDPTRLVDDMSGTTTADYDEGGGQVLDWHNLSAPYPGPVPPTSDGRAAVIGEFGAFGYAVPGHEYAPGLSRPNQRVTGAAELTSRYVTALGDVAGFVRDRGLSAANYNLFEDAELQVNGLFTYDRRVFKADDRGAVIAANRAVVAVETEL